MEAHIIMGTLHLTAAVAFAIAAANETNWFRLWASLFGVLNVAGFAMRVMAILLEKGAII
jgi:hypothetical protein